MMLKFLFFFYQYKHFVNILNIPSRDYINFILFSSFIVSYISTKSSSSSYFILRFLNRILKHSSSYTGCSIWILVHNQRMFIYYKTRCLINQSSIRYCSYRIKSTTFASFPRYLAIIFSKRIGHFQKSSYPLSISFFPFSRQISRSV